MKNPFIRLKQRAQDMRAERAARKRAFERGKKGVSQENFSRVMRSIKNRGHHEKALVFIGMATKIALDRMKMINTKKDPDRRQRIQKLIARMSRRSQSLMGFGKTPGSDDFLSSLTLKLAEELGGIDYYARFMKTSEKVIEELKAMEEKLAE